MAYDEMRVRFLRDRVMTATPSQLVVMLYDRFGLDLAQAQNAAAADDAEAFGAHLWHAMQVVGELQGSLNIAAGGPAENLAALYAFVLGELIAARGGEPQRLDGVGPIMVGLRSAFAEIAGSTAAPRAAEAAPSAAAGSWVS